MAMLCPSGRQASSKLSTYWHLTASAHYRPPEGSAHVIALCFYCYCYCYCYCYFYCYFEWKMKTIDLIRSMKVSHSAERSAKFYHRDSTDEELVSSLTKELRGIYRAHGFKILVEDLTEAWKGYQDFKDGHRLNQEEMYDMGCDKKYIMHLIYEIRQAYYDYEPCDRIGKIKEGYEFTYTVMKDIS